MDSWLSEADIRDNLAVIEEARPFICGMSNPKIDHIISSGQWEIDPSFGMRALSKYLADCEILSTNGATIKDLGYSEQRAALEPTVIGLNASKVSGRSALSSPDIPSGSIAHLRLSGVMRLEDGMSSRGVRSLVSDIQAADSNPRISGILLEVNSGGGESFAGSELQNALRDVQESGQTKIGVYTQMLASAAVRGTLYSDFILASSPSSPVGSVGTYATIDSKLLDEIRESMIEVYARQSTEKNIEYREMLDGNFEPLIDRLTESNQYFIDEVFAQRNISGTPSEIAQVEAGKLFKADVAVQRGLIDGVATFAQAVRRLEALIADDSSDRSTYNPAPGRSFNHQQSSKMKSLTAFLTSLIPLLSNRGVKVEETASAEDVLKAMQEAPTVEELVDAKVKESTETARLAAEANAEAITKLTETVESLKGDLTGITAERDALAKEKEALTKTKGDLELQVNKLLGKRGNTNAKGETETANDDVPDVGSLQTAKTFSIAAAAPKEKSKY